MSRAESSTIGTPAFSLMSFNFLVGSAFSALVAFFITSAFESSSTRSLLSRPQILEIIAPGLVLVINSEVIIISSTYINTATAGSTILSIAWLAVSPTSPPASGRLAFLSSPKRPDSQTRTITEANLTTNGSLFSSDRKILTAI